MNLSTFRWAIHIGLCFIICMACQATSPQEDQKTSENTIVEDSIPAVETPPPPPVIPLKYIIGKFEPSQDSNFVKIASQYTSKSNIYLHQEAYAAFLDMYAAAKKDGIDLRILSATRNFDSQKSIWEAKWNGQRKLSDGTSAAEISDKNKRALRILEYSSMPSTSRHHWGTDIDLNNLNNPYFEKEPGKKVYDWLKTNAGQFGYCQPYSPKGPQRPDGYNEEKWHWSYLPLAKAYLASAKQLLKNEKIEGFAGAEVAPGIQVIEKYVFGISLECKE